MQIPWLFPIFNFSLTFNKIPWLFPDFCQVWNFPDYSLTAGHPDNLQATINFKKKHIKKEKKKSEGTR